MIVLLRNFVQVRGHIFITVAMKCTSSVGYLGQFLLFWLCSLIINFYAIFYPNTIMALHFV